MAHNQPIRGIAHGPGAHASDIPDKLYFRIGEVARLCDVPAYVLRFWEGEFPQLKPNKGGTGQRLYRRRDVELALRVKTLLREEGYTIPGARQVLKAEFRQKGPQLALIESGPSDIKQLRNLRRELAALAAMLSQPVAARSSAAPRSTQKHANGSQSAAQRRASSRTQPAATPASPARASGRTPSGELLFDSLASKDDGN